MSEAARGRTTPNWNGVRKVDRTTKQRDSLTANVPADALPDLQGSEDIPYAPESPAPIPQDPQTTQGNVAPSSAKAWASTVAPLAAGISAALTEWGETGTVSPPTVTLIVVAVLNFGLVWKTPYWSGR